ncbi:UDP-N-acetylmuramoyl-tripeptide--D-alanyl-D-alanine ligase, partial [bacterium]|nr:UDP-N-acetylmuramoyl-tripeptide--D-alanyl-D-alanine ligase [bacterium]
RFAPAWLARGGAVLTDLTDGDDPLVGQPAAAGAAVLLSARPREALAALASAWRAALPVAVAGVTGTNGKTTTKDLLAALLGGGGPTWATAGNFNNDLGLPVTLLGLRPEHRFAVIEMGASAVGDIDRLAGLARPRVGVITNASPAHLAEFGSLADIITGKGELLDHLPADGLAVLNADSPGFEAWCARARSPVATLGRTAGDHRWSWRTGAEGPVLTLDGADWPVPLPGEHNGCNLAAAILAARGLGLADDDLRRGLGAFAASPHRGAVTTLAGRTVLDDAYNANPGSMVAAGRALLALPGGGAAVAVLGHMAELGPDAATLHRETGAALHEAGVPVLVAVGEQARPLGQGFDAAGGTAHYCASVDEAAAWVLAHTAPGDRILVKGSRSAAMERILPLLAAAEPGDPSNGN